jgi:hypothetical protein
MTDTTAQADTTVFVPKGRPVARFVAVVAALSVALGLIWATGVFSPRVDFDIEQLQVGSPGRAAIRVHNAGMTAARVQAVDVDDPYVHLAAPSPTVLVAAHADARIAIRFVVDCASYQADARTASGATGPSLRLRLRVRGPAGAWHRVSLPADAPVPCGEPASP